MIKKIILGITSLVVTVACNLLNIFGKAPNSHQENMIPVHITIDDELINNPGEYAATNIIEPVWWSVNIYDGLESYEKSLKPFSKEQRYVIAIEWYLSEVNNGGHDQFYFNSTGIVWKDALEGLKEIGIDEAAVILEESIQRMGGDPSFSREVRQKQLENLEPDFEDLDTKFYDLEEKIDIEKLMYKYILEHKSAFYFEGSILKPE